MLTSGDGYAMCKILSFELNISYCVCNKNLKVCIDIREGENKPRTLFFYFHGDS